MNYISKLNLRNFKCFRAADLEFSKLTILTGANSSGKSSLLYSILAGLQSSDFPYSYATNGQYVNLGDFKEIVNQHKPKQSFDVNFEINSEVGNIHLFTTWYNDTTRKLPKLKKLVVNHPYFDFFITKEKSYTANLKYYKERDPMYAKYGEGGFEKKIASFLDEMVKEISDKNNASITEKIERSWEVENIPNISAINIDKLIFELRHSNMYIWNKVVLIISKLFHNMNLNSNYLSSFRFQPERTYYESVKSDLKIGNHGENYIDQIIEWDSRKSKKLKELKKRMKDLNLLVDIKTKRYGGGRFEILVKPSVKGVISSLTDVGFGISQILPLLIADIQLGKDSRLYLSQPEIHLHPSVQAQLAEYFVQNTKVDNKQYVVETHSEYFINRIRLLIVKKQLDADDVRIYYISNTINSKIHNITFTDRGEIKGAPRGFFSTYMMDTMDIALNS